MDVIDCIYLSEMHKHDKENINMRFINHIDNLIIKSIKNGHNSVETSRHLTDNLIISFDILKALQAYYHSKGFFWVNVGVEWNRDEYGYSQWFENGEIMDNKQKRVNTDKNENHLILIRWPYEVVKTYEK